MKTYNLFISHSWSYPNAYEGLKRLLRARTYFKFKDYSVPQDDPIHTKGTDQELYEAIEWQIKPCSVVLILAGIYSTHSKWIDKEIKIADEYIKPIIAVKPRGNVRISKNVRQSADKIVSWNTNSIVSAIRELS